MEAIQLFKSLNRNQRNTFVACFLGWALDAFDFFLLTFVISANSPMGLWSKLLTLFGTQLTFKQNDAGRYADIVGRGAVELADIAGRGYMRVDRRPLQIQSALPVGVFTQPGGDGLRATDELAAMARAMVCRAEEHNARSTNSVPARIEVLSEVAPLVGFRPSRFQISASAANM